MESIGYVLVDILELHYADTLLFQVDLSFRRKNPVNGVGPHLFKPTNQTVSAVLLESFEQIKQRQTS